MSKEFQKIIDLMNEVQLAAIDGDGPGENHDKYIVTVNARIGEIEKNLALLKHELTKQGLNDW